MNEHKYNLAKVSRIVCSAYILYGGIFSVLTWPQLKSKTGQIIYVVCYIAVFVALALYGIYMVSCEKKGRECLGNRFAHVVSKYEFLIEQLVTRDFKIKYKRSVLGIFWSFLNPLLMMIVQFVVFSNFFGRGAGVEHYAIYLLCGIVCFNGFNDCTTQAMSAITANASLITKVYVPKAIYPVTKVFSASINLILSMVPLLLVTIIYGLFNHLYLTPAILLIPLALLLLILFILGIGFILSSLMVFFHDIAFLWGVLTTMWMYATPIIYPMSMLEQFGESTVKTIAVTVINANPLTHYVEVMRSLVMNGCSPALSEWGICLAWAVVMMIIGILVFRKTEDQFVLYI
ncbi:MAG: ABC transporter permease [Lachnospiraceae bacterium]